MKLWLAIDAEFNSLGVEKANTEEQAYYQFTKYNTYPSRVIELPDSVVRAVDCDEEYGR